MSIRKRVMLVSLAILLPVLAAADFAVKFFPGWSYHHQDDQIHDGATLWAIIRQDEDNSSLWVASALIFAIPVIFIVLTA